jgi:transcriptional regulator with XRE-family HTH domain
MRARFKAMTLQTLLRQHGITKIKEVMHRTGLSRQQSWNLWHGYVGVGKATAKLLHERLGIPAEQLLQVDPVPARKPPRTTPPRPRGRPRKAPQGREPTPPKEGQA